MARLGRAFPFNRLLRRPPRSALFDQYARPDADDDAGSWTTAPLWSKIDETPADDADDISSEVLAISGTTTIAKISLAAVTDPVSSVDHLIRVRAKATYTLGSTSTLAAELRESATLRATLTTANLTTSYVGFEYLLTAAEANSINDYSALALWVTGTFPATNLGSVQVSWVELEVPNAVSVAISDADTLTFTEAAVSSIGLTGPTDSGTATETATISVTTSDTDTASVTEAVPSIGLGGVADSASITDTATIAAALAANDSAALTEDIPQIGVVAVDSGTLTEAIGIDLPGVDSGSLTDTAGLAASLTTVDNATTTDSPTLIGVVPINDETITLTDAGAVTVAFSGVDDATLAEGVPAIGLSGPADIATLTDAGSTSVALTATDSAAATDSPTLISVTPATDEAITLTDSGSAANNLTATDSGSITDSSTVTADTGGSDSGSLVDTVGLSATTAAADSGTLADTSAASATVSDTDSGIATDTLNTLSVAASVNDVGALADTGTVDITSLIPPPSPREDGWAAALPLPTTPLPKRTLRTVRYRARYHTHITIRVRLDLIPKPIITPATQRVVKVATANTTFAKSAQAKTVGIAKTHTFAKHATPESVAWVAERNREEEAFLVGLLSR